MAIFVCDRIRNSVGRKEMEIENFLMASREKRKEIFFTSDYKVKQRKFVQKLTEKWNFLCVMVTQKLIIV